MTQVQDPAWYKSKHYDELDMFNDMLLVSVQLQASTHRYTLFISGADVAETLVIETGFEAKEDARAAAMHLARALTETLRAEIERISHAS